MLYVSTTKCKFHDAVSYMIIDSACAKVMDVVLINDLNYGIWLNEN
jgi:hypothetical protein